MRWKHTFKHVDVSESLKSYSEECFERASRFLLKDSVWQVYYSKGKHHDCCVEVSVQNGNGFFKASGHADSFYLAVDEVAEKLSKQFQKKKQKLQQHKEYALSKEARFEFVNNRLEYDHSEWKAKVSIKKPA
ncbi:MAG: ribosomal subunit interface protein [Bdellovibrio sp. CG10_big_fil_rev_8_21_14_0_10_47_8]|nr:MAG: ribosomal subunit interface protein [Bdellovibrio sp. CG10_big_fil_rev_8_21_14_0_10_47_8]